MIGNGYVKRGELTDKYYADRANGTVQVAEEVKDCAASVVSILSTIYDGHFVEFEDAHENNVEANVDHDKLKKKEFLALWEKINQKSFYTVSFDTKDLIQKAIDKLNSHLEVSRIFVKKEYGEQEAKIQSKNQLLQGEGFRQKKGDQEVADRSVLGNVRYDLVGKLVEETGLTRATIAAILAGMAPIKFAMYRLNPEEFILKAGKIINNEKATAIIQHITYNKLDAVYDTAIFTAATLRGKLGQNAMPVDRSIYDYLIYDSEGERKFAGQLDINEKVAIYVKLPKSFFISTPVGKYSPDWAIAFHEGTVKHVYFIAETKGSNNTMELRGVEEAKIECAKAHFAAISNSTILYDVVKDFEELINLVS